MTAIPQFEASFDRLFGDQQKSGREVGDSRFFSAFYARFTQHAEVARLFAHTDMARQISMLKRSIFDLVGFYVAGVPSAELYRLADLHARLGIDNQLLDLWLEALLETVLEFDEHADELVRLAWIGALAPGLTVIRMRLSQPEL